MHEWNGHGVILFTIDTLISIFLVPLLVLFADLTIKARMAYPITEQPFAPGKESIIINGALI